MSKELNFQDGNDVLKYQDSNSALQLYLSEDGLPFDLSRFDSLTLKVGNENGYLLEKPIDLTSIASPKNGNVTVPLDGDIMTKLIPGDYNIELWSEVNPIIYDQQSNEVNITVSDIGLKDSQAIFPSDGNLVITVDENIKASPFDTINAYPIDDIWDSLKQWESDTVNSLNSNITTGLQNEITQWQGDISEKLKNELLQDLATDEGNIKQELDSILTSSLDDLINKEVNDLKTNVSSDLHNSMIDDVANQIATIKSQITSDLHTNITNELSGELSTTLQTDLTNWENSTDSDLNNKINQTLNDKATAIQNNLSTEFTNYITNQLGTYESNTTNSITSNITSEVTQSIATEFSNEDSQVRTELENLVHNQMQTISNNVNSRLSQNENEISGINNTVSSIQSEVNNLSDLTSIIPNINQKKPNMFGNDFNNYTQPGTYTIYGMQSNLPNGLTEGVLVVNIRDAFNEQMQMFYDRKGNMYFRGFQSYPSPEWDNWTMPNDVNSEINSMQSSLATEASNISSSVASNSSSIASNSSNINSIQSSLVSQSSSISSLNENAVQFMQTVPTGTLQDIQNDGIYNLSGNSFSDAPYSPIYGTITQIGSAFSVKTQIIVSNLGAYYFRVINSWGIKGWYKLSTDDELSALNSSLENLKANSSQYQGDTEDANNATVQGTYTTNEKTVNIPVNGAVNLGLLNVICEPNSNLVVQQFSPMWHSGPMDEIWFRSQGGGSWQPWHKFATSDDMNNVNSEINSMQSSLATEASNISSSVASYSSSIASTASAVTSLSENAMQFVGEVQSPTGKLQDIPNDGIYNLGGGFYSDAPIQPLYGILIQTGSGIGVKAQRIINNLGDIYYRAINGWGIKGWYKLSTDDEITTINNSISTATNQLQSQITQNANNIANLTSNTFSSESALNSGTDLNTVINNGIYSLGGIPNSNYQNATYAGNGSVLAVFASSSNVLQIIVSNDAYSSDQHFYYRSLLNGAWSNWISPATKDDINNTALTFKGSLSGGSLAQVTASGIYDLNFNSYIDWIDSSERLIGTITVVNSNGAVNQTVRDYNGHMWIRSVVPLSLGGGTNWKQVV